MPIVLLATWSAIDKKVREFVVAMLILETGMIGTFLALDLFVFYVFWEVMLIPMYFIIGIWGGDRRLYASIKFVIYTMVGSLLMIVAILYLYVHAPRAHQALDLRLRRRSPAGAVAEEQLFCFAAFALAFCIKVPLFPFHTWLPDAHVEAPTAGSVVLAAVHAQVRHLRPPALRDPVLPARRRGLRAAARDAGGRSASSMARWSRSRRTTSRSSIAYSSVAHLGFVVLGLVMWNVKAIDGAIYRDAGARHLDGRPVPLHRRALRAPPHARHRRVRRPRRGDAALHRACS